MLAAGAQATACNWESGVATRAAVPPSSSSPSREAGGRAGGAPRPGPGGAGLRPAFPGLGAGPASCGNGSPGLVTRSAPGEKEPAKIV